MAVNASHQAEEDAKEKEAQNERDDKEAARVGVGGGKIVLLFGI